jgi:hypothetical protein
VAEPLPDHDRVGGERAVKDAVEVDIQDPAPVVQGQVAGFTSDRDASVIEQIVQVPVSRSGVLHQAPDVLFPSHVDGASRRLPAVVRDGRCHPPGVIGIDVCDDHLCAAPGQLPAQGLTDPRPPPVTMATFSSSESVIAAS